MRRAAKVDDNQGGIVEALRVIGATVWSTASVGKGFPDIVVGYRGVNFLFEVKREDVPPSKQKLTPKEQDFHDGWRGQVSVIKNIEEAMECLKNAKKV